MNEPPKTLLEAAEELLEFADQLRQRLRAGAVVDDHHLDQLRRAVETSQGEVLFTPTRKERTK